MRVFRELMEAQWAEGRFACQGLDTGLNLIPREDPLPTEVEEIDPDTIYNSVYQYNKEQVAATHDVVGFYKPNIAFYEGFGPPALQALRDTITHIKKEAPTKPVILDAKRADIGPTNEGYIRAAFGYYGADALTVNPYFGKEALQPFLAQKDKGIIVLCRTSNPGAGEFQDLFTLTRDPRQKPDDMSAEEWLALLCSDAMPLYERVGGNVAREWNKHGNCLLVVGATYPVEAKAVRRRVGSSIPFLVPGVGKQGGDVEATVLATIDDRGWGILVNSSSAITFAKRRENETQANASRREALALHTAITKSLPIA